MCCCYLNLTEEIFKHFKTASCAKIMLKKDLNLIHSKLLCHIIHNLLYR